MNVTEHLTKQLSKRDIVNLLALDSPELFEFADTVRKENVGDAVHLRGLIEFSNYCGRNCLYCGLRLDNLKCTRYRLTESEILRNVERAVGLGLKTIVLQSGEDAWYTTDKMVEIIAAIKKFNVALTLSVGEKPFDEYKAYKDAGANRYLLRIETTDKRLYSTLHPNASWEERKDCLLNLKKLGYELGTGCLVGLPGQTLESLADDILFFKEIGANMVGIGPFIANTQTPLSNAKCGSFELALKVMALTRLVLPKANIPATTAMETIHPNGRLITLQSGANVAMPNVVDWGINQKYAIYQNKASNQDGVLESLEAVKAKISGMGRMPL